MSSDVATGAEQLTPLQYDLLLYCEQAFWRSGYLPSYEQLVAAGIPLSESEYNAAVLNQRFINALKGRGLPDFLFDNIRPVGETSPFSGKLLTERQMTVANVMMDTYDKRSRLKKLTELGVSTQEYNLWLRDPTYRQYCLERSEQLLQDSQPQAHLSLIDLVSQGNLAAIKYFNHMTGRFAPRGIDGNATSVSVNLNRVEVNSALLGNIVEIIQRHVKDPEILRAIGDDILALNARQQSALNGVNQGDPGSMYGFTPVPRAYYPPVELPALSEVPNYTAKALTDE